MASDTEAQHQQHQEEQELTPNGDSSNGGGGVIEAENELPSLRPTTPTTSKPTITAARPPHESSDNEDDALGTSSAEDGFSQDDNNNDTSPPSVTSPPYWAHGHNHTRGGGGTRHARTMSSVSAESDLPPGAITLQDNEHDDGPDGANVYGRDRNRACWAKKVDIVDYILVNGGTANIGAFVVWNIRVETLNVRIPCLRLSQQEVGRFLADHHDSGLTNEHKETLLRVRRSQETARSDFSKLRGRCAAITSQEHLAQVSTQVSRKEEGGVAVFFKVRIIQSPEREHERYILLLTFVIEQQLHSSQPRILRISCSKGVSLLITTSFLGLPEGNKCAKETMINERTGLLPLSHDGNGNCE